MRSSTAVLIKNFTIYPSAQALEAGVDIEFDCSDVTVEDNIIANFSEYVSYSGNIYGAIVEGRNCIIRGNTFINDGLLIAPFESAVEDNVVNGKPLVYLEGVSDVVVSEAGEVILVNCDGVRIESSTLSNTTVSIELWETNDTEVVGNTMSNSYYGVYQYQSSNSSIRVNNIAYNSYGVFLFGSSSNTLSSNRFEGNTMGIYFVMSSATNIFENSLARNLYGVAMIGSDGNAIHGNTIEENLYGVWVEQSSGNAFYHNNFVNNTQQAYISYPIASTNVWDNGCEGNYWSDYEERYPGATYDYYHIWDTPYVIDESNQDNYPMQNPYWNPGDINNNLEVEIYDAVLVCEAYDSTPSDDRWNPHCDIAEPYGVINIYDVVIVCSNYAKKYPS